MAALVPGAVAGALNFSASPVEAITAALRSSNIAKGKTLLEIAWQRPIGTYHGAVIEAVVGRNQPVVLVEDAPDGASAAMAVVDITDLLASAGTSPIRVIARPRTSTGELAAYQAGITPETRVPRRKLAA